MGPPAPPLLPVQPTGIPLRNLWHMLLYAWRLPAYLRRWDAAAEKAPDLPALLATILADLLEQRLRVGLGRDYRTEKGELRGVRGRIDFDESLRLLSFQNGRACCRFPVFSPDAPKNRMIRATVDRLARLGILGVDRSRGETLRARLRGLARVLDGVALTPPDTALIRRQPLARGEEDYRLMLALCDLLWRTAMPAEETGHAPGLGLDRDSVTLHEIYERFVANFYKLRLADNWSIAAQPTLTWAGDRASPLMPVMRPDLVLTDTQGGRRVVIDTKFTGTSLVRNQYGSERFASGHIYQLYAYLRSQEGRGPLHRAAEGVLLYPEVGRSLDEAVELDGHRLLFQTVDLALPWRRIEERLLAIIANS